MDIWQWLEHNPSILISTLSLFVSTSSAVLSLRADRRAQESVRPFVSTGVHIGPDDMKVTMANYGVGVAIVTKVAFARGTLPATSALAGLLTGSPHFIVGGVHFIQSEYYLRPGDTLNMVIARPVEAGKTELASVEWANALEGIDVSIKYKDVLGREFGYFRTISTRGEMQHANVEP